MEGDRVLKSLLPKKPEDLSTPKPSKDVSSTEIKPTELEGQKTEIKSEPYGVSYFGVKGWGEMLMDRNLDSFGVKDKIVFIEDYLVNKLSKSNMKTDRESIQSILSDIEKELHLDNNFEPHYRVKRVSQYLEAMKRVQEEEDLRKERLRKIFKK